MSKSYCLKCGKEVAEDVTECECGGRTFIYGKKFYLHQGKVVCECGSEKFKANFHMDSPEKAVNNYVCLNCGNPVGREHYRSEEEKIYWED